MARTAINVNKQSVAQLLETGKTTPFVIPEYQRPYAWSEDQVTVLAHQLHDQRLVSQIPHFIQMLNIDMHDTLQPRLGNVHDTAVL